MTAKNGPNRVEVIGLRLTPLPHRPACGFDGASLALRAVPQAELSVSLRSAAPGGSSQITEL
jgi:hypothetical protein